MQSPALVALACLVALTRALPSNQAASAVEFARFTTYSDRDCAAFETATNWYAPRVNVCYKLHDSTIAVWDIDPECLLRFYSKDDCKGDIGFLYQKKDCRDISAGKTVRIECVSV